MKKKMGILGGLLMAVVVTGYSVAGTYAKYISAFDMADEARVASWNFNDEAEREVDLFQSSYTYGDNGIVVASKDADKVVAPGTSGSYKYKIVGTAETNYKVTTNIKIVNRIILAEALNKNETYDNVTFDERVWYNPIEFSFDGENWQKAETPVKDTDGNVIGFSLEGNVRNNVVYPANHDLELEGEIYWRWLIETGDTAAEKLENNYLDTALATGVINNDLTLKANVGVTVEQTQDAPNYVADATTATSRSNVVFSTGAVSTKDTAIFGYIKENSKDVTLSGTKLTGTIYKTTNDYTNRYMGNAATGYYYALNLTIPEDVKSVTIKDTWANESHDSVYSTEKGNLPAAGKVLDLIYGLKENQKELVFVFEYNTADAEGNTTKEVKIDLNGLKYETR